MVLAVSPRVNMHQPGPSHLQHPYYACTATRVPRPQVVLLTKKSSIYGTTLSTIDNTPHRPASELQIAIRFGQQHLRAARHGHSGCQAGRRGTLGHVGHVLLLALADVTFGTETWGE